MKNLRPYNRFIPLVTILLGLLLSLLPSFRTIAQKPGKSPATQNKDLKAPGNKPVTHGAGDKNAAVDQAEIQKAMKEVENAIQNFKTIDLPNLQLEIEKALKTIDLNKIQQETQVAIRNINVDKIQASIQKAMKEANLANIHEKVAIEFKTLQNELASLKKENMEDMKQEMHQLKMELQKTKIGIQEQAEKAMEEMSKAKTQLENIKEGLDELEKDGLKKKDEKVNIEFKDGTMYLNGNVQPKKVSDKYKKYFDNPHFNTHPNADSDNHSQNRDFIK